MRSRCALLGCALLTLALAAACAPAPPAPGRAPADPGPAGPRIGDDGPVTTLPAYHPVALDVVVSATEGAAPLTITATATASSASPVERIDWTRHDEIPITSGPRASFTLDRPGTWYFTTTATNTNRITHTRYWHVHVLPSTDDRTRIESLLVAEVNRRRAAASQPALTGDATLATGARQWAQRTLTEGLVHDPGWFPPVPWSSAGEVIDTGHLGSAHAHAEADLVREVVDRFMDSPGHRSILLDPEHRRVGAGLACGTGHAGIRCDTVIRTMSPAAG